jgi:hypothetical protein
VLPLKKRGRPRKNAAAAQPAADTPESGLDALQTREGKLLGEEGITDEEEEEEDGDLGEPEAAAARAAAV